MLDTVRRDHVSSYGYDRPTSPNLDRLAERGVRFTNAYSTAPWTLPSHASLFTGLYPIGHGATHEHLQLNEDRTTLAEILSRNGYETIGVIANAMLEHRKKLDQGFDQYHEAWLSDYDTEQRLFPDFEQDGADFEIYRLRRGVDENAFFQVERSINDRDVRRPMFLFINFVGPHSPYDSSGPFRDRFVTQPDDLPSTPRVFNDWARYYAGTVTFTDVDLNYFRDLYDAEILHADYLLNRVVDVLKQKGMWENTLLIVTSDHGENFGELGHVSHLFSVNEPLIRIPLVIHDARSPSAGTVRSDPVQLVDLFPTILAAAGISPEQFPNHGTDLSQPNPIMGRPVFAEYYLPVEPLKWVDGAFKKAARGAAPNPVDRYRRRLRTVIDGNWKYIWAGDDEHELYDLASDPGEETNLIGRPEFASEAKRLAEILATFVADNETSQTDRLPEPEEELDAETLARLQALGYIK